MLRALDNIPDIACSATPSLALAWSVFWTASSSPIGCIELRCLDMGIVQVISGTGHWHLSQYCGPAAWWTNRDRTEQHAAEMNDPMTLMPEPAPRAAPADFIAALGFEDDVARLRRAIDEWVGAASAEMQEALRWQFLGSAKYFRPVTVFSCYRALNDGELPGRVLQSALALELFHNVCSSSTTSWIDPASAATSSPCIAVLETCVRS